MPAVLAGDGSVRGAGNADNGEPRREAHAATGGAAKRLSFIAF